MSNWRAIILESNEKRLTFRLSGDDKPLAHKEFLELLSENKPFIKWYNQFLASTNFDAFFWENMPVTTNNLDEIYECTLVKSATLAHVSPDQSTFESYFESDKNAVSFPNLGGDAQLVVPCPNHQTKDSVYTHIGSFVRQAPDDQIHDFWTAVGTEMLKHVQKKPRWLSTSGLGVYWLHVRIDSVPKYYQTEAYKKL